MEDEHERERTRQTLEIWTDCMEVLRDLVRDIHANDRVAVVLGVFGNGVEIRRYITPEGGKFGYL